LLPLALPGGCRKATDPERAGEKLEAQAPLIGVAVAAEGADYANYRKAVEAAGGRTILIPMLDDETELAAFIAELDGVLIPGGADIPPDMYGEEAHPSVRLIDRRRAEYLVNIARIAIEGQSPLLGICLGQQVMNVARGGTLIQDIPTEVAGALVHGGENARHEVSVVEGSRLAGIVGDRLEVDSSHHQAIEALGEGLVVTARSDDGIIEGVEMSGERFVVGVQWHPERILERPGQRALFAAFVEACKRRNQPRIPTDDTD
jgi:putative glutamine amidotransferase